MVNNAADVRALVITPDAALASAFMNIGQELGIACDASSAHDGIPQELEREKYEAFLIDFDCIGDAAPILSALRANPSNRRAIVFACATEDSVKERALTNGANFVLARPVDGKELRCGLYAAYDAMTQERRRYFRCAVELPVFLKRSDGSELTAVTGNVSANGMSITSSARFSMGERIGITLDLQNAGPHVVARGVIVWDDRHGKSGISFQCVRPELQDTLDEWLDQQFQNKRADATRELRKARAAGK